MKSSHPLFSIPAAIIFGSLIIAFSILWSSGVVTFTRTATGMASVEINQPAKATAVVGGSLAGVAPGPQPTDTPPAVVAVGNGHFPALGDTNAPVTIIEFADLRCPFCKQLEDNVIPQIKKDYIDTGKAKLYFRQYAFLGPASTLAANAVECANEQNKFWQLHDYLYKNQPDESETSMYTVDNLTKIAGQLGMDTAQFNSCLSANKYSQKVSGDLSDGQKLGVNGTPTTFINGKMISGAQPVSIFQQAIEAVLK